MSASSIIYKSLEAEIPGFVCRSSTRQGGVSQGSYQSLNLGLHVGDEAECVLKNRKDFARDCGIKASEMIWMQQVHGTRVVQVDRSRCGEGTESLDDAVADCDAMICAEKGVFLAVGQADCLAAVVVEPQRKIFGVVHAGWRGAASKAPAQLVKEMVARYGVDPAKLQVALSPALGPQHLQLDASCLQRFKSSFGSHTPFIKPGRDDHFFVDLWECARLQMLGEGCRSNSFIIQNLCTFEHESLFFSYRRGPKTCGRMATIAGFRA